MDVQELAVALKQSEIEFSKQKHQARDFATTKLQKYVLLWQTRGALNWIMCNFFEGFFEQNLPCQLTTWHLVKTKNGRGVPILFMPKALKWMFTEKKPSKLWRSKSLYKSCVEQYTIDFEQLAYF